MKKKLNYLNIIEIILAISLISFAIYVSYTVLTHPQDKEISQFCKQYGYDYSPKLRTNYDFCYQISGDKIISKQVLKTEEGYKLVYTYR